MMSNLIKSFLQSDPWCDVMWCLDTKESIFSISLAEDDLVHDGKAIPICILIKWPRPGRQPGSGAGLIMIQETKIRKLPRPCWLVSDEQSTERAGAVWSKTVQKWLINRENYRATELQSYNRTHPPHLSLININSFLCLLESGTKPDHIIKFVLCVSPALDEGLICHVKNSKFFS